MKSIKYLALSGVLAMSGLVGGANAAYAAASYCSVAGSPNTDGLALSDAKFLGANSNDCYGIVSDDDLSLSEINTIWSAKAGSTLYSVLTPGNNTNVTFGGVANAFNVAFSLSGLPGASGTWGITITDLGAPQSFPVSLDLVLAIEDTYGSPDKWATYLFNNVNVANGVNNTNTTWAFTFGGGNRTADSARLFIGNGTPGTGSGSGSTQAVVPEPASLLLLGSGLGLAAWRARRKAAK